MRVMVVDDQLDSLQKSVKVLDGLDREVEAVCVQVDPSDPGWPREDESRLAEQKAKLRGRLICSRDGDRAVSEAMAASLQAEVVYQRGAPQVDEVARLFRMHECDVLVTDLRLLPKRDDQDDRERWDPDECWGMRLSREIWERCQCDRVVWITQYEGIIFGDNVRDAMLNRTAEGYAQVMLPTNLLFVSKDEQMDGLVGAVSTFLRAHEDSVRQRWWDIPSASVAAYFKRFAGQDGSVRHQWHTKLLGISGGMAAAETRRFYRQLFAFPLRRGSPPVTIGDYILSLAGECRSDVELLSNTQTVDNEVEKATMAIDGVVDRLFGRAVPASSVFNLPLWEELRPRLTASGTESATGQQLVMAVTTELQEVLWNLIINAVKRNAGEDKTTVSVSVSDQHLELSVANKAHQFVVTQGRRRGLDYIVGDLQQLRTSLESVYKPSGQFTLTYQIGDTEYSPEDVTIGQANCESACDVRARLRIPLRGQQVEGGGLR